MVEQEKGKQTMMYTICVYVDKYKTGIPHCGAWIHNNMIFNIRHPEYQHLIEISETLNF